MRFAAALAVLSLVGLALAPGLQGKAEAFCETERIGVPVLVHDYGAPFEHLPPIHEPRHRIVDLPIGPPGLKLRIPGEQLSQLYVVGEPRWPRWVGFGLEFRSESGKRSPRLDWVAVSRLVRVARRERAHKVVVRIKKYVRRITAHDPLNPRETGRYFALRLPPRPSMYRLEFEIRRRRSGRRLGRFGSYLRVLPLTQEARLTLNAETFHRGDTIKVCLENHGTDSLLDERGQLVEAFDEESGWRMSESFPVLPTDFEWGLGPGGGTSLRSFEIPTDTPPGRYRYFWQGRTRSDLDLFTLTTEFQIVSSP